MFCLICSIVICFYHAPKPCFSSGNHHDINIYNLFHFFNFSETILVAFWHFSDQFGLCYYLAICGTVAYSPLPAEEEKVFSYSKTSTYLLSFSCNTLFNLIFSFLIDESTKPAVIQTSMGIDDKEESSKCLWFGLLMAVTPTPPLLRPAACFCTMRKAPRVMSERTISLKCVVVWMWNQIGTWMYWLAAWGSTTFSRWWFVLRGGTVVIQRVYKPTTIASQLSS